MQLYKDYCKTEFDENGILSGFELNYPENYNFGYDVVDRMAQLVPNETAMIWTNPEQEERIFSYAEISKLSNQCANVFKSYGITKGDKVLVILKRNYEYWYVAPALHKLGAVLIPATHLLTQDDITYRVNNANIKAAVCTPDGETAKDLFEVSKRDNTLTNVFVPRKDVEGCINLTQEVLKAETTLERVETKASEPMIIYFSSGTTGYPKAVEHDHTYTLSHIITAKYWQCVKEGGLHLTVAETGWGKASWGKIYGQWLCGCSVMVYDFDKFSPSKLLKIMEKYKVTSFCAPPTVYRYFVKKGMNRYNLESLEHITTAGEALNPKVFDKVYEQTGFNLMEGFGQTESVLMLANLCNSKSKPGSMGKPTPLYDVHIVNEDGEDVDVNVTGEVVVVPPTDKPQHGLLMSYYGDEELYKKAWRNGVYHTGDTAYKDEDGYFWYVGRIDDLIKTRGFRVGPFEIENVVMQHPDVLECAVIGVPDDDRGQAIKAIVKLADSSIVDNHKESEIKAFCNQKMASYKWIQIVEIVDEFPKTISGKIKRTDLRAAAK